MIPDTVPAEVTILSQHSDRTWHATLPNGKAVIAFRTPDESTLTLAPGERAPVELSVSDFSRAHLVIGTAVGRFAN